MKRCVCWILAGVLILSLSACGGSQPSAEEDVSAVSEESSVSAEESSASVPAEELPPEKEAHAEAETESSAEHALSAPTGGGNPVEEHKSPAESPESGQAMPFAPEESSRVSAGTGVQAPAEEAPQSEESEEKAMNQNTFVVSVGGAAFNAAFAENSGAQALKELLAEGPMTLSMRDYGGFEKVGALGRSLPTSNAQITTQTGDIVLYQGNQIVIFYGPNSWSYTRLGRIADLSGWAEALGSGDVEVTLSLPTP